MAEHSKFIALTPKLYEYVSPTDTIPIRSARISTPRPPSSARSARMQIAPEQGTLMGILATAIGARSAVEVGTFTGYSSLCVARGCPPTATCCAATSARNGPRSHAATGSAPASLTRSRSSWPAAETSAPCPRRTRSTSPSSTPTRSTTRLLRRHPEAPAPQRPDGLRQRAVERPGARRREHDADTQAIRALNDLLANGRARRSGDARVADGLTIVRKK